MSVLLTIVMSSFQGSSGARLPWLISKLLPVAEGAQRFFSIPIFVLPAAPCTISIHASRVLGLFAAVRDWANAGSMESRKGKATVAPIPRSMVRREICFLVMNINVSLFPRRRGCCFSFAHLERGALHNPQYQ